MSLRIKVMEEHLCEIPFAKYEKLFCTRFSITEARMKRAQVDNLFRNIELSYYTHGLVKYE